jgi:hypothetical protein
MFGMSIHLIRWLAAVVVVAIAIPIFFLLANRDAFLQPRDKVVIRQSGSRFLGKPEAAKPIAGDEIPYALLNEVAYQKAEAEAEGMPVVPTASEAALEALKWTQWQAFLNSDIAKRFSKHHLRVQVWENRSLGLVAVTFGGTDPKNIRDWIANFRWFIPDHDDEYTLVVRDFGTAFNAEYLTMSKESGHDFLAHATLMATGHSLD